MGFRFGQNPQVQKTALFLFLSVVISLLEDFPVEFESIR